MRRVPEHEGHLRIEPGEVAWNPLAFEEAEDAWRFAGGTADVLGAAAARAGLQLLLEVGIEAIAQHLDQLTARFVAGCLDQGIRLLAPMDPSKRGPMVVLRTPKPARLTAALAEQRIWSRRAGQMASAQQPLFFNPSVHANGSSRRRSRFTHRPGCSWVLDEMGIPF